MLTLISNYSSSMTCTVAWEYSAVKSVLNTIYVCMHMSGT